jgi:predicted nucleotidyltransferase
MSTMKKEDINAAINKFRKKLIERFGNEIETYLFGSIARGDYDDYSDIDILVLLPFEPNNSIEEQIFDLAYDVGLEYNVIFGIIVYSSTFWNSGIASVMPIHENIEREGISV